MINKIKKNITKQVKGLVNKITEEEHPLKKLVDMALKDGILSEKERKMLFEKVEELDLDKIEFEFYLENELEKTRKKNLLKMEKLIQHALKDNVVTDKEREMLFEKAKLYHLDEKEFEFLLETRIEENNEFIADKEEDESIGALKSRAKIENNSVEKERKQRRNLMQNKLKKYQQELESFQEKNLNKDLNGWWGNLSKDEKIRISEKAEVGLMLGHGISHDELYKMYYIENLADIELEKKNEISKFLDNFIENEIGKIKEEKELLSKIIDNLHSIPNKKQKKYKIPRLIAKIEANINVDIKVLVELKAKINMDINGAEITTSVLNGIIKFLSSKEAIEGFFNILKALSKSKTTTPTNTNE